MRSGSLLHEQFHAEREKLKEQIGDNLVRSMTSVVSSLQLLFYYNLTL